jgi:hypothetical protein
LRFQAIEIERQIGPKGDANDVARRPARADVDDVARVAQQAFTMKKSDARAPSHSRACAW